MTAAPLVTLPPLDRVLAHAATNEPIREIASGHFAALVASGMLLRSGHDRSVDPIRGSDIGKCALALWASINGADDLAVDASTVLTRFDEGHLTGGWNAALLKAALEKWRTDVHVELEQRTSYRGIPGHADALIWQHGPDAPPIAVVEFKWNADSRLPKAPHAEKPAHFLQAAEYAMATGAPAAIVVTTAPACKPTKANAVRWRADEYEITDGVRKDVDTEIDRLLTATHIDPPPPDPTADYFCKSCSFSACKFNRNPSKGDA